MNKKLIYNGFIVNEGKYEKASLVIEDKIITDIIPNANLENFSGYEIINAERKFVLPGIIDTHVHFRDPGITHKADIYTESRAAAAGGVTTFFDMPNTIPQVINKIELEKKFDIAKKKSLINYSFYIAATKNNIEELQKIDKQTIPGIKLFYASTTGDMLLNDKEIIKKLFKNANLPIVIHSEENSIIENNLKTFQKIYKDNIPIEKHPEIRSAKACITASKDLTKLALENNTKVHFLHISTLEEVEFFQSIDKKNISLEVTPNHLFFDSLDYRKKGSLIKCNPAIKDSMHKIALLTALKYDVIDTIATDHAPHTLQEKRNTYLKAPSGIPSIQHSLNIMLEFVNNEIISLEKIVEKMCHNPAKIFNIYKRGFLKKGYYADIIIVDLDSQTKVDKKNLLYKCKWSPLEGYTFGSKILSTIVNGQIVYQNEKINETNSAEKIKFDR